MPLTSSSLTFISALPGVSGPENVNKKVITNRIVVRREANYGLGLSIAGGIESNPYIVIFFFFIYIFNFF